MENQLCVRAEEKAQDMCPPSLGHLPFHIQWPCRLDPQHTFPLPSPTSLSRASLDRSDENCFAQTPLQLGFWMQITFCQLAEVRQPKWNGGHLSAAWAVSSNKSSHGGVGGLHSSISGMRGHLWEWRGCCDGNVVALWIIMLW